MEKNNPAESKQIGTDLMTLPKATGSDLTILLNEIKRVTGKSYAQIAFECGYQTTNYFSQLLNRDKKGTPVPLAVIGKVKSKFAAALNDQIVIEMPEEALMNKMMENIAGLRTQVAILTAQVAKLQAYCYRSDFENEHAALKAQMKDGVELTARTM